MEQSAKGIDRKQVKIIHTLKNALGLTEEEYRLRIIDKHGFSGTSKDLSFDEAKDLIDAWEKEAIEKGVWKRRSPSPNPLPSEGEGKGEGGLKYDDLGDRPGMASPKQLRMIEAMWRDVSFTHKADARQLALRHFIFRITGVSEMRFLEKRHARAVIEAINAMKRKHGRPASGQAGKPEGQVFKDRSANW